MMRSAADHDGDDDDDDFGPNPFRSSLSSNTRIAGESDLLGTPNAASNAASNATPASSSNNNNTIWMQPDPSSGMTGVPPQTQSIAPAVVQQPVLSGAMDTRQAPAAATEVFSTPFSSVNRCLSCFRLDGYMPYFDFDTIHIYARIKASLTQFHLPDQFRTNVVGEAPTTTPNTTTTTTSSDLKGPDLYGPLWITLTLVFVLAAMSNFVAWRKSGRQAAADATTTMEPFEYDITHLLRAFTVVTTMAWLVPTLLCVACTCLGLSHAPSWPLWMCVYGYSMTPYILASVMIGLWPHALWEWIMLACATAVSGLLVLRNLSTPLLIHDTSALQGATKATPIVFSILGSHAFFLLILRVVFF